MKRQADLPTLMQVRREHDLTSQQLAQAAGVPLFVEYRAEIGAAVTGEEAEKLLRALSRLTGQHYTQEQVHLLVMPVPYPPDEPSRTQGQPKAKTHSSG